MSVCGLASKAGLFSDRKSRLYLIGLFFFSQAGFFKPQFTFGLIEVK
jgi:hypothetical protein